MIRLRSPSALLRGEDCPQTHFATLRSRGTSTVWITPKHCRGCAHINVLIRSCRLNTLSRSEPERLDIRTGDSDKTHSLGTLRGDTQNCESPGWPIIWFNVRRESRIARQRSTEKTQQCLAAYPVRSAFAVWHLGARRGSGERPNCVTTQRGRRLAASHPHAPVAAPPGV
jgi:hypothetical protein